tara:strand:+ start:43 stop:813 length:771 start_codon:yes stop_codon:yes gene_type:complete
MIDIIFLGTGTSQGVPIIGSEHPVCKSQNQKDKRLRVSVALKWGEFFFVIDCGPDFRQQMLNCGTNSLDGILYTHEHADHTAGLDDIRPFYFKQGKVDLILTKRVFSFLKKRFDYIFDDENKYPGAPSVNIKIINKNQKFILGDKEVVPIEVLHGKLPILGYRIDNFAYLTDVKSISDDEILKLKNLDVLVLNALRKEEHHSHLNLKEALSLSEKINPKKTFFTHISHHMGFHDEIQKKLPINTYIAYDNLSIKSR